MGSVVPLSPLLASWASVVLIGVAFALHWLPSFWKRNKKSKLTSNTEASPTSGGTHKRKKGEDDGALVVGSTGIDVVAARGGGLTTESSAATAAVEISILNSKPQSEKRRSSSSPTALSVRRRYLAGYLLMSGADWVQGSYVYAIYEEFGLTMSDISILYVADFASALFIGTMVSSLSDNWGSKRGSLVYAVVYILSCVVYHFPSYHILLLGCLLDGIANSLLNSSFETWIVQEHTRLGLTEKDLKDTFSSAVFYNGVTAIIAGYASAGAAEVGGSVATFDFAIALLAAGGLIVWLTWHDNGVVESRSPWSLIRETWALAVKDTRILMLSAIETMFESVLFTFVFIFTPALGLTTTNSAEVPRFTLGVVFAAFMAAIMIGSGVYRLSYRVFRFSTESMLQLTLAIAAAAFFIPVSADWLFELGSFRAPLMFFCFCLFELSCGLYYPTAATLRSKLIDEDLHATVTVCLRLPLNAMLILMLMLASSAPIALVLEVCCVMMVIGVVLGWNLRSSDIEL